MVAFLHLLILSLHNCVWAAHVADKPPMGLFSGQRYACNTDCNYYPDDCISEKLIDRQLKAMKSLRLDALGYEYLILDDGWMAKNRDPQGKFQADSKRFPSGMKNVTDMVHSAGFKLGLYISLGNATACGFPGTEGHKQDDAQTLADWGVDLVYVDATNLDGDSQALSQAYQDMSYYLSKTGRPFLVNCLLPYYLQKKGAQIDWPLVTRLCHVFRVYDDTQDSWESLHDVLKHFGDSGAQYVNYSGPGHWLDPGQLLVGDFGLSENQQRMQLAVWSVIAAPSFLSTDLTRLSAPARNILTNQLAVRVNQDALGVMGRQKAMIGQVRIWMKPVLPTGSFALALLYENISGGPEKVSIKLTDIGMTTAAAYNFTDIFSGQTMGVYKPWYTLNTEVNPTGVKFILAEALP